MASYRKIKKDLKKIYKEALLKDTIPYRWGVSKCALIRYRNGGYYPLKWDKNGNIIRSKNYDKTWDIYEISYFSYDEWTYEYDSWSYRERLVKDNKDKPMPHNARKIKANKLKFKIIDA